MEPNNEGSGAKTKDLPKTCLCSWFQQRLAAIASDRGEISMCYWLRPENSLSGYHTSGYFYSHI
jgi:hypothetical protein